MTLDSAISKCDELIAMLEGSVSDKSKLPKMVVDPDDPWASTVKPPGCVYKEKCPLTGYLLTKPFEKTCPMPGAFQGDVTYLEGLLKPILEPGSKSADASARAAGGKDAGSTAAPPKEGGGDGGQSKKSAKKEAKAAAKAAHKGAEKGGDSAAAPAPAAAAPAPAAAAPAAPAAGGAATVEMWEKALMKVGHVLEAGFVENSDKLYICQVEVGEERPRQIITGLRHYVPQDQLQGAKVVVILNLKTAKLAGINSEAMIMATEDASKGEAQRDVKLLIPPPAAQVGEQVYLLGAEPSTKTTKTLKSSIWDSVKGSLRVKGGVGTFNGTPLVVASGTCTAHAGIPDGSEIK